MEIKTTYALSPNAAEISRFQTLGASESLK
jgi:hypothetical protein